MYSQLLRTEFVGGAKLQLLALASILFFFVLFAIRGLPVGFFMGVSLIVYWAMLIASGAIGSEEKRIQLYARLPVTTTEISFAMWFIVLTWLAVHVCFWILYGVAIDPEFSISRILDIATTAIGVALFVSFIGIGIDLGALRSRVYQRLYLGVLAGLFTLAIFFDVSIGIVGDTDGIQIFPMALLGEGYLAISISILVLFFAMVADHLIFTNSDHYLR